MEPSGRYFGAIARPCSAGSPTVELSLLGIVSLAPVLAGCQATNPIVHRWRAPAEVVRSIQVGSSFSTTWPGSAPSCRDLGLTVHQSLHRRRRRGRAAASPERVDRRACSAITRVFVMCCVCARIADDQPVYRVVQNSSIVMFISVTVHLPDAADQVRHRPQLRRGCRRHACLCAALTISGPHGSRTAQQRLAWRIGHPSG